jgi:predicted MFS family arabinose efflux permease
MSTISFFQNIGIMTGSAVFGILATSVGWSQASLSFLVPLAALSAVLTFFIKEKRKKSA